MRRLVSPSWLLRHVLAIFLVALFLRLGWWQLVKGESARGSLQNLFYGLEWPVFAGAVVFFWWRMVVEELRPPSRDQPEAVRAAPPLPGKLGPDGQPSLSLAGANGAAGADGAADTNASDDEPDEDIELAAYNRYLAALHEADQQTNQHKQTNQRKRTNQHKQTNQPRTNQR